MNQGFTGSPSPQQKVHGYEVVASTLADLGVQRVFGLMGDDVAPVVVALSDLGVTHVSARHENQAVAMADAYSTVNDGPGVAVISGGPGFSNCITGLLTAAKTRSKVLLLTSESNAAHKSFPTDQICRALGIPVAAPRSRAELRDCVAEAYALSDRHGTCVLIIPPALLHEAAPRAADAGPVLPSGVGSGAPALDQLQVDAIADLLEASSGSSRTVVLAGAGAVRSHAIEDLQEIADSLGAITATTLRAACAFERFSLNVGIAGTYSSGPTTKLLGRADCVLAFGASLNRLTTYDNELFGKALMVQVDTDANALGKFVPIEPELRVHADAGAAARALRATLDRRKIKRIGYRAPTHAADLLEAQRPDDVSEKVGRTEPSRLDPTVLAVLIDQLLPPDRVIVADGGRFATHALSHLHARDARHIVQMNGGGSIGLGLGAAVGASFARPEMPVALVTGDSSFMMALTDLDTAVRHRRPIVIFVFNDQAWGAEVAYLESIGLRADVAHLPTPDIAAIARAHGARGITVSTYDELEQVRQFMSVKFDEPMVVDCRIADDTPSSSLDFLFSNSKVS